MSRFLKLVLFVSVVVTARIQLTGACTFNECETPCKVVTYFHASGDGLEYVGGRASYAPHTAPSPGGVAGPSVNVTVKFYDVMCIECADCIGTVCEGSNPDQILYQTTDSQPQTCIPIGPTS